MNVTFVLLIKGNCSAGDYEVHIQKKEEVRAEKRC